MTARPEPVRHVDDDERRARIGVRHGLHPDHRFPDLLAATRGMTALHATEPATVHLGLRARVDGVEVDDVERALYEDRSIVKLGAMRQTLFGFTREQVPGVLGSASARLAGPLAARLAKDVVAGGLTDDGDRWVRETGDAVVEALRDRDASSSEVRDLIPALDAKVSRGAGKWGAPVPVAPPLLWVLFARGRLARSSNGGHWRLSKPRWTATQSWLGEVPEPLEARAGYAELVGSWLRTFGPGTEADLVWWLGGTKGAVRTALADIEAVPVGLDDVGTGWLLPHDVEVVPDPGDWVALLPTLDSTVMGWRGRDFYLGPHAGALFDAAGNAGTTVWWNGRVVGAWRQSPDGVVRVHLLEDIPPSARDAVDSEATRLTEWLDGVIVTSIYVSEAMRAAGGEADGDQSPRHGRGAGVVS